MKDIDEKFLVENCVKKNSSAQRHLYDLYAPKMMGVVKRFTCAYDDQVEIIQLSFIKVFDNIERFTGKGSLEGWIRRIVVNTALSFIKKNKSFDHIALDVITDEPDLTTHTEMEEISYSILLSTLDTLDARKRMVFSLFVFESYSHKEISEELNITIANSRSELTRARIGLRKALTNHLQKVQC